MVALSHRKRLNVPLAPLIAGVAATLIALIFALLPSSILGRLVLDSGIAALVPAAEPPLGFTARAVLMLIGGGGVGLVTWFTAHLLVGTRTVALATKQASKDAVPTTRRADAHPDAPPRRPLFANEDLGAPFQSVRVADIEASIEDKFADEPLVLSTPVAVEAFTPPVERDLPADLNKPLAAFDPRAIREDPLDWFPSSARQIQMPHPKPLADGERLDTYELTQPAAQPEPVAPRAPRDPAASIHSLLDRLEKGVTARAPAAAGHATPPVPREDNLQEALSALRRLASRA